MNGEMDVTSIVIGAAAILYGAYTLYMRSTKPESFGKLEAMKRAMGEDTGEFVHFIAYTILPLILGIASVFLGINGKSILSFGPDEAQQGNNVTVTAEMPDE